MPIKRLGAGGTNTSDATATAADIASGKTAYGSAGTKLTGTSTAIDVADTTATADDVVEGKYFYSSGGIRTLGVMPVDKAATILCAYIPGIFANSIATVVADI